MLSFQLSCPTCGSALEIPQGVGDSTCSTCGHTFSVSNGIVDFIPENTFYWGEIAESLMKKINEQAEKGNWLTSLTDNLTGRYKQYVEYILDPVRYAGIFHFYDEAHAETCLDLGSGWGPISFGLSRFYKKVYSVDGVYERLRFQSIRARQSGIENIKFLRSTMLRLPIPDNSVDVVIVNGLLEWIGLSDTTSGPADLQKRFLNEVRRVLKPQGQVMIGIENRFGIQYFRGVKDHSGLPFTSLMPRKLASWVVKKFKRGDDYLVYSGAEDHYRTLTYSYWGYEHLVKKAGFQNPKIYWSWPTYNYPYVTGTPDGGSVRYYLGTLMDASSSWLFKAAIQASHWVPEGLIGPFTRMFSPHFLIVASKGDAPERLEDKLVGREYKSFIRTTQGTALDFKTTYHCLRDGKLSKVVTVLEENEPGGKSKFAIQELGGIQGRMIRPDNPTDIRLAANWLSEFHKASMQGVWQAEDIHSDIAALCEKIHELSPDHPELHGMLDSYQAKFLETASSANIPMVTEHGDFTLSNLVVDDSGKLNVLGCRHTRPGGQPLMDIGGFYLSLLRRNSKVEGNVFSEMKSHEIDEFCSAYRENTNLALPVHLSPAYYLLRLISQAAREETVDPYNYLYINEWLEFLPPSINLVNQAQ